MNSLRAPIKPDRLSSLRYQSATPFNRPLSQPNTEIGKREKDLKFSLFAAECNGDSSIKLDRKKGLRAPVVAIRIELTSPHGDFNIRHGLAFAFGKQYLFTTSDHLCNVNKFKAAYVKVFLTDLATGARLADDAQLDVYTRSEIHDVAILHSPVYNFQPLELISTIHNVVGMQIYIVDLDQPRPISQLVLRKGECLYDNRDEMVYARSKAKITKVMGGPVTLLNGKCIGLHMPSDRRGTRFITSEGLVCVIADLKKGKLDRSFWGIQRITVHNWHDVRDRKRPLPTGLQQSDHRNKRQKLISGPHNVQKANNQPVQTAQSSKTIAHGHLGPSRELMQRPNDQISQAAQNSQRVVQGRVISVNDNTQRQNNQNITVCGPRNPINPSDQGHGNSSNESSLTPNYQRDTVQEHRNQGDTDIKKQSDQTTQSTRGSQKGTRGRGRDRGGGTNAKNARAPKPEKETVRSPRGRRGGRGAIQGHGRGRPTNESRENTVDQVQMHEENQSSNGPLGYQILQRPNDQALQITGDNRNIAHERSGIENVQRPNYQPGNLNRVGQRITHEGPATNPTNQNNQVTQIITRDGQPLYFGRSVPNSPAQRPNAQMAHAHVQFQTHAQAQAHAQAHAQQTRGRQITAQGHQRNENLQKPNNQINQTVHNNQIIPQRQNNQMNPIVHENQMILQSRPENGVAQRPNLPPNQYSQDIQMMLQERLQHQNIQRQNNQTIPPPNTHMVIQGHANYGLYQGPNNQIFQRTSDGRMIPVQGIQPAVYPTSPQSRNTMPLNSFGRPIYQQAGGNSAPSEAAHQEYLQRLNYVRMQESRKS